MEVCFAKILLFGEHTVVNGGRALAIPFHKFSGHWTYSSGALDRGLIQFADYIDHHDSLYAIIDVDAFFADLDRGLKFESTIPIGYGLGSSGALVAATFKKYAKQSYGNKEISKKLKVLADLESFFHGKSSGFDPLVSYLNQPILIDSGKMAAQSMDLSNLNEYSLFIIDTNQTRETEPLVKQFQAYRTDKNELHLNENYLPHVNQAIDFLIRSDPAGLFSSMEAISGYQYAYLDFLIDEGSKTIWKEGLASNYFKLKICGAGGGGYLLGITSDMDKFFHAYPNRNIIKLI